MSLTGLAGTTLAPPMKKTRRGRPRGQRHLHPSTVVVEKLTPRLIARDMPHRRNLLEELRADQRAESVLGRMSLHGQISENMYLAGRQYAAVVGAYMATISPPHSLAGRSRGYDCPGNCPAPDADGDSCVCRLRRSRYMAAFEAIAQAGHQAVKAVNIAVIQDREVPFHMSSHLQWGLAALVGHFGLAGKKRS